MFFSFFFSCFFFCLSVSAKCFPLGLRQIQNRKKKNVKLVAFVLFVMRNLLFFSSKTQAEGIFKIFLKEVEVEAGGDLHHLKSASLA